ncbi:cubilin [Trichonephila clavipes]|nr:cubilin [Trichonephila clavipes]
MNSDSDAEIGDEVLSKTATFSNVLRRLETGKIYLSVMQQDVNDAVLSPLHEIEKELFRESSWKYPRNLESRLWQRFQEDGNVSRCYRTGRPRVTTPNEDWYLAVTAKKKQTEHSIRPVSSALFSYRYDSFKADRIETLRAHWSICSAPGTRYHQENTIERHRYGGAGWLVWGGIILGSRTDLHVQSVTMTGHIYRDVILEQHVRLFWGAIGAEFLFMDDNTRPHRANIVDECLQSEDITRMGWPAYSPDLNPI